MRKSKVERLPAVLREELERLWREGRYTLDELLAKLREMAASSGEPDAEMPSRSGLHAYLRNFEKKLARLQEAKRLASAWMEKLGADSGSDIGRLLSQMLMAITAQRMDAMGEDDKAVKPMDLMLLATTLKNVAGAEKTWADRELKIRKELAAKVEKVIAEETKKPGGGLSEDAAERIRAALMGKDPRKQ